MSSKSEWFCTAVYWSPRCSSGLNTFVICSDQCLQIERGLNVFIHLSTVNWVWMLLFVRSQIWTGSDCCFVQLSGVKWIKCFWSVVRCWPPLNFFVHLLMLWLVSRVIFISSVLMNKTGDIAGPFTLLSITGAGTVLCSAQAGLRCCVYNCNLDQNGKLDAIVESLMSLWEAWCHFGKLDVIASDT